MTLSQAFLAFASLLALSRALPVSDIQLPVLNYKNPIVVRYQQGAHEAGDGATFELKYSVSTVQLFKERLGKEAVMDLIKDDLDASDVYWKDILAKSNASNPALVSSRVEGIVSPDILNTTSFLKWRAWSNTGAYPNRLVLSSPQHFFANNTGGGTGEFVEMAGDTPITFSYIHPAERQPYMSELLDWPHQDTSMQTLRDGTVLSHFRNAFRDKDDGTGFEAESDIYFPEALPAAAAESAREHLSIEVSNWILMAYDDITSGAFVP